MERGVTNLDSEIITLNKELERVETEGFGALKPIYNFYENTVTNILKKQGYNPILITDEYGNTWNEVVLNETRDLSPIQFNLSTDASQLNLLNTDKWFNQVIIPVLNKMSNLFPQIKSEVVSENNLEGLSPEVRNKIENIKSKGFNVTSFFLNGKVYVIRERVTKDIAIEEFLHPFINTLEKDNPELYKSLLLEAKKLFPQLKEQIFKDYKDIYDSVFDLNREFLTQVLSKIMGSQEEYSPEVQSWFDKFVNWIKQLFKSLSNSKQLQNYNIQDIDKNISLNELAILLSKEGTVFKNLSIEINNNPQWNISEDRAKEYLSYAKNNLQKEAIEKTLSDENGIRKYTTQIKALNKFYEAEDYHQDYHGSCRVNA